MWPRNEQKEKARSQIQIRCIPFFAALTLPKMIETCVFSDKSHYGRFNLSKMAHTLDRKKNMQFSA